MTQAPRQPMLWLRIHSPTHESKEEAGGQLEAKPAVYLWLGGWVVRSFAYVSSFFQRRIKEQASPPLHSFDGLRAWQAALTCLTCLAASWWMDAWMVVGVSRGGRAAAGHQDRPSARREG